MGRWLSRRLRRGVEGGFDLLLELVEADAEGFLRFGRGGFEPGFGDELKAALLAAEPEEAEGFRVGAGGGGAGFFGEDGEGGVEGGVVVGGEMGDGVGHGVLDRVGCPGGIVVEGLYAFKRDVIPEAELLGIEYDVPGRNDDGRDGYGKGLWSNDGGGLNTEGFARFVKRSDCEQPARGFHIHKPVFGWGPVAGDLDPHET